MRPLLSLLAAGLLAACPGAGEAPPARTLRVATTTSLDHTGLLETLLPPFEARTGIRVQVLAVGTGQALALGRNGDVDLVLVHDVASEEAFVAGGHGLARFPLMVNDFVVAGPPSDPAGIAGTSDASAALARVADAGATFVSRGDDSGTHQAEKRLWAEAGVEPGWEAYLEAGQGMRPTLNMADEKRAYCLVDRGTWLDAAPDVDLVVAVEGDPALVNPYAAIPLHPATHPESATVEAMALVGWLSSAEGQAMIGDFRRQGQVLFHPTVVEAR